MSVSHVIDTHCLIWFFQNDPKLSPAARAVLADPNRRLIVPAIVIAEICWMIEIKRFQNATSDSVLAALESDASVRIDPLDLELVRITTTLHAIPEMHDRQIVAAAIRAQKNGDVTAIVTADRQITRAGIVPIIW